MSKRLWTGLLVGVIAAVALVAVGVGAFHAGQSHEITTTVAPVVGGAPGETVRAVGYGHWGPWGGGPRFGFLIPLLFIGLIVLLIAGRRRAYWGGPYGPCGPGERQAMLHDWHRQAHAEQSGAAPGEA